MTDKDSLQIDKPRRTPNHPTKSHIVKTKVDGKEKIIRFGEQGASTAGKPKEGESDRMKAKRASFKARHAQNIAKGKSSAAYWANRVKWADGGPVYDKSRIDSMVEELMNPQGFSAGGVARASRKIGEAALPGAPETANVPNVGQVKLGQNPEADKAAERAAELTGVPYRRVNRYAPVDVARAKQIAREYDLMKHNPDDPLVKMAYDQMIKETTAQYQAMLDAGIEPYFFRGADDPYKNSPYEALLDIAENRRLGVYPTSEGFGSGTDFDASRSPMLAPTEYQISGEPALVNDLFRAVHDYFGHAKSGVGFRAAGEENAFQAHAGMFSPLARRALATETRGQNSWLNYGPYGESNRTAKLNDTRFADQKTGLLPRWVSEAGTVINDDRRQRFFDSLRDNTGGLQGAITDDGKLRLVHYSATPLERIDPERYGTGLSRFSRAERNRSYDPNFVKRSYYGIPALEEPYRREFGVGPISNEVLIEPELLYDARLDPEGLRVAGDPTLSEKNISNAGYTGYYSNDEKLGKVAVIFDPYDVTKTYAVPIGAGLGAASAMTGEEASADEPVEGYQAGGRIAAAAKKAAKNASEESIEQMYERYMSLGYPEGTARKIAAGDLPMDFESRMKRATDLGYTEPMYVGTTNGADIFEFNPDIGEGSRQMTGTWGSADKLNANTYALAPEGQMYQLLMKPSEQAEVNAAGRNWSSISPQSVMVLNDGVGVRVSDLAPKFQNTNDLARLARAYGADSLRINNVRDMGSHGIFEPDVPEFSDTFAVFKPQLLRSKLSAAFDPDELDNNNILAGGSGVGLGLGALLASDDEPVQEFQSGGIARAASRSAPTARAGADLDMSQEARMQRAAEMGFDTPAYHVSRMGDDITAFHKGDDAVSPFDAIGVHVGTKEAANYRFESANKYRHPEDKAGVMYPLKIKKERMMLAPDGNPWTEDELSKFLNEFQFSQPVGYRGSKDALRESIWSRYDAIPYINDVEDKGSISYIVPPQNIRSVNAAFDPDKLDSANLSYAKGGAVESLSSMAKKYLQDAYDTMQEAGGVYKAAVANMYSPFEPVSYPEDPNDWQRPQYDLRVPGIVDSAIGMGNIFGNLREIYGGLTDQPAEFFDNRWKFDAPTAAQDRYSEDLDSWLQHYIGKDSDELSMPMSAVLGASEILSQPGVASAKLVQWMPKALRAVTNVADAFVPVSVVSPGGMATGAGIGAALGMLPHMMEADELEEMDRRYTQPPAARYRGEVARRNEAREDKLQMIRDKVEAKASRRPAEMAQGGPVFDQSKIDAMVNELMEPQGFSGGGAVGRAGSRSADAAARKAAEQSARRADETPQGSSRSSEDYLTPAEREFLKREIITGQQVSERVPTGKNYVGDPYDPNLKINVDVIRQMPEQMRKQADVMANYLNYPENAPRDPESVFRLLGDQGVENLLWLHDQMPEDVRRMSSYWYEGANKMAGEASQRYGIPIEGTAGVYAALSPQMDWFKNVSLGNRVMDIMSTRQNQMFTPEMRRRGQELVDLPSAGFNQATAGVLERIRGSRLGDLNTPVEKAIWLRLFDEAHNPREYNIVDPMGNIIGPSLTNKGVPARVGWGGLGEIAKAISMFEDPSISNVTRRLGEMHKVRGFYNNIVDPYTGESVTSDTHNVAAALLRPLSGSSTEVLHNLGSASSSDVTGARGTYGLYADTVRRAARERGLDTPRAMQSITWEGVRGLYPPEMKRSQLLKQKIDNAFTQYRKGQISGEQLRETIGQEGGGIRLPAWYAR